MNNRIFLYGLLALVTVVTFGVNSRTANVIAQGTDGSTGGTNCSTMTSFLQPTQGDNLSDIRAVQLKTDDGITQVDFKIDGKVLGRGKKDNINNQWFMPWNTLYSQPGQHGLTAVIHGNGNTECTTEPILVNVNNPHIEPLQANMSHPSWNGLTNTPVDFIIDYQETAPYGTANLSEFAVVNWSAISRGSVSGELGSVGHFSSGPDGGNGTVRAIIKYGGQSLTLDSHVMITSPYVTTTSPYDTTTSPYDTTTNTSGGTNSSTTGTEKPTSLPSDPNSGSQNTQTTNHAGTTAQLIKPAEVAALIIKSEDPVDKCVVEKIGEENIQYWKEKNRSPNSDEFHKFLSCFKDQKFVIPSVLAPVPPNKVVSTVESSLVKLSKPTNEDKAIPDSNKKKKVLVFSGTTTPNTNVLFYVFSEPLVLATTSDSNGVWTYTLEDPLASGEHEVYALVEKGNGEYERSGVEKFVIGKAEASDANPNGYSLGLISEPTITASNRTANLFIAATIGMVTFISVILFSFWIQRLRRPSVAMMSEVPPTVETPTHIENDKPENTA